MCSNLLPFRGGTLGGDFEELFDVTEGGFILSTGIGVTGDDITDEDTGKETDEDIYLSFLDSLRRTKD